MGILDTVVSFSYLPYLLTPVLTVSGAAGAEAISLQAVNARRFHSMRPTERVAQNEFPHQGLQLEVLAFGLLDDGFDCGRVGWGEFTGEAES